MKLFILFLVIFCHIIADFHVQTEFMAKYKQKKEWEPYGSLYKYDWIPMLIIHSFSWSFVTFISLIFFMPLTAWCAVILINTIIHFIVDDLKCNKLKINLIADQSLHIAQIMLTIGIIFMIF